MGEPEKDRKGAGGQEYRELGTEDHRPSSKQEKGARSNRSKYTMEQDDWGEPSSQEQISDCSTIELPPKEQRTGGRRSKQKTITDYLNTPEDVPLEPAGNEIPTGNWTDTLTEEKKI